MAKWSLRALLAITGVAAVALTATAPAQAQSENEAKRGHYGQAHRFAGRDYCWYEFAWRGPGWYRCGYQWRRDLGWGGHDGWLGWYPYPRHHHYPHWGHPRPGPVRPPAGSHPAPGRPPRPNPPGGAPAGPR